MIFNDPIQELFFNEVKQYQDRRILDVGCGNRCYERLIPAGNIYVGIDVEVSGRISENKKADVYFDGVNIPYETGKFDLIVCNQVLEHAVDVDSLMVEMVRVLKPGGILWISVPFIWGEHETPFDFRRFSSFGLKKLALDNGLLVKSFQKIYPGVEALRMLMKSEITVEKKAGSGCKISHSKFFTKLNFLLIKVFLGYLGKLYSFGRIYQNNLLVAEKKEV